MVRKKHKGVIQGWLVSNKIDKIRIIGMWYYITLAYNVFQ